MDKLDVIKKARKLGGDDRRDDLVALMIKARELGCDAKVGGGRAGGINFRYGSIGYAIMDVNTKGQVKLYASPHPGADPPESLHNALNDCIERTAALNPKTFPINSYGRLEDKLEDVPNNALYAFIAEAVEQIYETYYRPHIEAFNAAEASAS